MKCGFCQKNNSIINSHVILNGEKTESGICKECYEKILGSTDIESFMSTVYKMVEKSMSLINTAEPVVDEGECIKCGMPLKSVLINHEFGCQNCFEYLLNSIEDVKLQNHGSDLDKLNDRLLKAIDNEEYEEAAKIRDKIKELGHSEQTKQNI